MTLIHYMGAALVLILIIIAGIYSGNKIESADEFDGGRNGTVGLVTGAIIGTLVGGSSTIGTAQLAYTYGFSALGFCLGGSIGVLILGLIFSKPFIQSKAHTFPELFEKEYGERSSMIVALLNSLGAFLSIVAQILSGAALITAVSSLTSLQAMIITLALMMSYVLFGGVMGAGVVGIVKTIIVYISVGICGLWAIYKSGGLHCFFSHTLLPHEMYFNLFSQGIFVSLGGIMSMIIGVLTTQSYFSAIITAKSLKVSRQGALLSAVLIPCIGVAGIFVGMYMKINAPDIDTKMALPLFILNYISPFPAGIMLAALLVTVVGTGAGLALGISSIFYRDIYVKYIDKNTDSKKSLWIMRMTIVVVLVTSVVLSRGNNGNLILKWSFMSMGLRGSVAVVPLCTALFFPGKIKPRCAMIAMLFGPLFTLLGKIYLPSSLDSLFFGIAITVIISAAGYHYSNN